MWPRDFLSASASHSIAVESAALPSSVCVCVCVFIWHLQQWQRSDRNPRCFRTGVALTRLLVRRDLRTSEEEDVEAKAFQCLGEGAGAEEEGELRLLVCFGRFKVNVLELRFCKRKYSRLNDCEGGGHLRLNFSNSCICVHIFSNRMSAQVSANICGDAEQTQKHAKLKTLCLKHSLRVLSNFTLAFALLEFLYSVRVNHCCRCSLSHRGLCGCHHESEPPTPQHQCPLFSIHVSCGVIHASLLHISLSLFSAISSQLIITVVVWRTSLFRDTSQCAVMISRNGGLIYWRALWRELRQQKQTFTSKTLNSLMMTKIICSLDCAGGLNLQGRRRQKPSSTDWMSATIGCQQLLKLCPFPVVSTKTWEGWAAIRLHSDMWLYGKLDKEFPSEIEKTLKMWKWCNTSQVWGVFFLVKMF